MATTTVIAFSKAWRVRISRGRIPSSSIRITASPARRDSSALRGSTAVNDASPGSDRPITSMATDMVLAVNNPPQDPSPGHAAHSSSVNSSLVMRPAAQAPTASNTSWILMSLPLYWPGRMLPPYTNTLGMFRRAMAMTQPGMFLSQPPTVTSPSIRCPKATVSMESAMTSRLTSDAFMPSVPMLMPSLTVMVPNWKGVPPPWRMPSLIAAAHLSRWTLHGVTSLARLATATKGFARSSSVRPIARR